MPQLSRPVDISKTTIVANNTVVLSWKKAQDYELPQVDFEYKFVNETTMKELAATEFNVTTLVAIDSTNANKLSATITFTDSTQNVDDYWVEIKAIPGSGAAADITPSVFGRETSWFVDPSLTVTIGGQEITLTRQSRANIERYGLADPITLNFSDLRTFVETNLNLSFPALPNGDNLTDGLSLVVSEFFIITESKLFLLSISLENTTEIIPGLSIDKIGVTVRRTDGSI